MIIPRTPSPSPVPSLGGLEALDDLNPADIRRLARERLAEIRVSDARPRIDPPTARGLLTRRLQNERAVKNESPGVKREHTHAFDVEEWSRNVRPKTEGSDVKPDIKRDVRRDVKPVIIDLSDD